MNKITHPTQAIFKEAKKALLSGNFIVTATGVGHHPMSSFRIIQIRFEEGSPYGKSLSTGLWYPLLEVEIQYLR